MSKEEFEAIKCVNDYLFEMACEGSRLTAVTTNKYLNKTISFEEYRHQVAEFEFWVYSYKNYCEYYSKVSRLYYKGDFDK